MNNRPSLAIIQYVVFGSIILYFGSVVFVPIAYAALISFVLYPICVWLERKGLGRMLSITIGLSSLVLLFAGIVAILAIQLINFAGEWDNLRPKFVDSLASLRELLPEEWISKFPEQVAGNVFSIVRGAISVSATSLVMAILIPVYVALILYYRQLWKLVLCRLFAGENSEKVTLIIKGTISTYYNFIKGMTIVYLVVGLLNSLGLLALGVPHAFLFGFIASILTFIPYVGIIVGALLPVSIAWITHDSIWFPIGVAGVFMFVQYLEANVIFPFAVGNRLKVNTMAVLISIFIGGILWGVSGMILFVPFVGILKLIAQSEPKLQTISLALGTSLPRKDDLH